jgi:hypothetical protein
MTNKDNINIEIPIYIAKEVSEWKYCYAPLLREIAQACYSSLYENKIVNEE